MAAKPILVNEIWRTVGTGADTYVWDDVWLPTSPVRAVKPRGAILDKDLKVHHLIDFDMKKWKVDLIENLIEAEDIPRILSLRISKSGLTMDTAGAIQIREAT